MSHDLYTSQMRHPAQSLLRPGIIKMLTELPSYKLIIFTPQQQTSYGKHEFRDLDKTIVCEACEQMIPPAKDIPGSSTKN